MIKLKLFIYSGLIILIITPFLVSCTDTHSESNNQSLSISEKEENGIFSKMIAAVSSQKKLEVIDYVKWVEKPENGLNKTKSIDRYRYSLQYKPIDYMIAKDLAALTIAKSDYDSLQKVYDGFEYYTLSIEDTTFHDELIKSQLSSRGQYDERIFYFSFQMQNDIQLISGSDTIPCSLLHFERTFNISPKANFLLGFPVNAKSSINNTQNNSKTLVYEDKVFKTGIIKLRIEQEAIQELPAIKILQ